MQSLENAKPTRNSEYSEGLAELICDFLNQWKYPVCIIYGNPETGKTDTGCLIAEIGLKEGKLDYFASNMNTYGHGARITSLDDVKYWHRHQTGKKLFILDEAGINDDARSPLSKLNKEIRHEIFIARKFKVHWVFIIQEMKDIDNWKSSELTGMTILKKAFGNDFRALVKCKWLEDLIPINDFPRTAIDYDTLDVSPFTMERQLSDEAIELKGIPAQVAHLYSHSGNFSVICKTLKEQTGKDYKPMQVKRALMQYLRQSLRTELEQNPDVNVK